MPTEPAHPHHVSRLGVLSVFAACGLCLALALFFRQPAKPAQVDLSDAPEGDRWKYTPEGRLEKLNALREHELKQAAAYAWIDQSKGLVQLPLERAMELTLQEASPRR